MIPTAVHQLRRSHSNDVIRYGVGVRRSNSCGVIRQQTALSLSMGPVSMAIVLYVGERLIDRLMAGQLLRKGVARKMRRLMYMILDVHVMYEIFCDCLEDIQ
jgi:hypothetical protein